jgi:aryl-alcohol dehydrogenase-like predicted oxidoreductase
MIGGYATSSETSSWCERHAELCCGSLGRTGLKASQAGFGGYRVSAAMPDHAEALQLALASGINLVDTSANYADGQSEELIGEVIAQMVSAGRLRREEVVLVSKAGYLQGRNYLLSQERRRDGNPFPELVPYGEGLEHCIHPEFLEDQLDRSLARLGVETLDVYLLHNPEYFLGWALGQGQHLEQAQAEYLRRIEQAFCHLETEVSKGRIRSYGISSNTFPVAHLDPQFSCLEKIWQKAESITAAHHFHVIQMPMNLIETGAVLLANQPSGMTALALAQSKDLGVLINRPLNAFTGKRLVRLADVNALPRIPEEEVRQRIAALQKAETGFVQQILPMLGLAPSVRSRLATLLPAAEVLAASWNSLQGYDHWRQVQNEMLLPRIRGVLAFLEAQSVTEQPIKLWRSSYQNALEAALQAVGGAYAEAAIGEVARIKTLLKEADPDWAANATLSQLALRALRSTKGVSCVLVGMRRQEYVDDVISELHLPVSVQDRKQAWIRLQKSLSF